uniref:Posterior sex combs n=2 Tax=Bombyx mori TaxID=7091 RepID=I6U461_BOMMO|nr:posterior sex combs [Bombyx mori]
MVTSNIISDKKVVKMDNSNVAVVPQRTLLGEVNEHITCPLCRGYYIDATTIVECLHSFCRSCIIKHLKAKSYCPVCEMMINSAKPNIKLDKALQDIVYKLVPGLFQKEMERRQHFYASRPGQAATATPEQRGEDTERIIFSPEDVISFSLEYADVTDTDSISSKSSDSNEPPPNSASTRRYLQCPAVVNISHLKKFLSKKFDVDSSQFAIDILYKKVPLPDYYTLMDIAYIYNWKRNEPMRFFYQIIDYVAIRNRIFDINRKRSHFHDQKLSPVSTEDTSTSSPAPNLHDHASEASSGPSSPVPDDNNRNTPEVLTNDKMNVQNDESCNDKNDYSSTNKLDEDVEKSQFLNSFELTAKSSCIPVKSPQKFNTEKLSLAKEVVTKSITSKVKAEDPTPDNLKRKNHTSPPTPELKKLKVEISNCLPSFSVQPSSSSISTKTEENQRKHETVDCNKNNQSAIKNNAPSATPTTRDLKQPQTVKQQVGTSKQTLDNSGVKRTVVGPQNILSPKRKPPNESTAEQAMPQQQQQQKTLSPLKLQIPKLDAVSKTSEAPKPPLKKIPDLKPSMPMLQSAHSKSPAMNKVRMDLLANNSDPTIDRSKILSQVKSSMGVQSPAQNSGDPLKSLFDSCKINIPSSLSITLTDQKSDNRCPVDTLDPKKNFTNKNLAAASSSSISAHKVPSPPVHNYIEILKLPESDSNLKKIAKNEADSKTNSQCKPEISQTKPTTKGSETSTKGPVPNLKPIADTKLAKQAGNFSTPITFQQTFEQQLQSLQCDKKGKPKNKAQVPKLVPATPKSLSAVTKPIIPVNKPTNSSSTETKTGTALDLTTPHNIQSQLAVQQTFDKALETMHSIANLAKKQNLPSKGIPMSLTHSNIFPGITSRPLTAGINSVRLSSPNTINQVKLDKPNPNVPTVTGNNRQESSIKSSQVKQLGNMNLTLQSPAYQIPSAHPPSNAQPSPRSQTRSPSSSPKLVIAEEKQTSTTVMEHNVSQLNQVTSTHITNFGTPKGELSKTLPGPSKPSLKQVKNLNTNKVSGVWPSLTSTLKTTASSSMSSNLSQHIAKHMEVNAWIKAQRQYEFMKNMGHQNQNEYHKDKQ